MFPSIPTFESSSHYWTEHVMINITNDGYSDANNGDIVIIINVDR